MAISRPNQFVRTVVDGQKILDTFGNCFPIVSQRPAKANPEKGLDAGTKFTLQIIMDKSPVIKDKETGTPLDDNRLNTFDVTIPGCPYPAPFAKGECVALGDFMADKSYFIDYNLILRYGHIEKTQRPQRPVQQSMVKS